MDKATLRRYLVVFVTLRRTFGQTQIAHIERFVCFFKGGKCTKGEITIGTVFLRSSFGVPSEE